jgi:glycosyltransferase involved in cell wall biosynthesis
MELSILLPCLNEELTVGACVDSAALFLRRCRIHGEVLVADNSSSDRSRQVALEHGARVVRVSARGYGNALRGGIRAARGTYIIMADADGSYDLARLMPFVRQLRQGHDLVMGNRFRGGIAKGAMPWHHRYIGNPVLSWIGRVFFRTPARDFHCGLRGFTKAAALRMDLQSGGMELASEIVIKASLLGMKVCEVPTTLQPDRRDRPPHLRSWRDGWRHLRFLLLYSPSWLFAYPGVLLVIIGSTLGATLFAGPVDIGARLIDFHSLFVTSALIMLGISTLAFFAITRVYAYNSGLLPSRPGFFLWFRYFNLERGLLLGAIIALLGAGLILYSALLSVSPGFAAIGIDRSIRLVFGGSMALIIGAQTILTSLVLSLLGLNPRR